MVRPSKFPERDDINLDRDGNAIVRDLRKSKEASRFPRVERGSEELKTTTRRVSDKFPSDVNKAQVFVKATIVRKVDGKRMRTTFVGTSSFVDDKQDERGFRQALIGVLQQSDVEYDEDIIIEIRDRGFISYV